MGARRNRRWGRAIALAAGMLIVLALGGATLVLRASLPQLDGVRQVAGLADAVTVARDARGVPLLTAANRADLAYATGFIHAQERFFQMDLMRRSGAGELAELFGVKALPLDRSHRLHCFRARAEALLARMPDDDRRFLARYVDGVNGGLQALGAKPFEYVLTASTPRPWQAADCLLVAWAMYVDLQGMQETRELARGWVVEHSDAAQRAFLLPTASVFDAPLDAEAVNTAPAPIPERAPAWWGAAPTTATAARPARLAAASGDAFTDAVGSNNWAVAGSRSASGHAIVSNDMHLGLQLPATWYRLAMQYRDAAGQPRRLVGLTLPGAPPVLTVGSNGHVAWGYTNAYGDFLDLLEVQFDRADGKRVRTASGWQQLLTFRETIVVKGAPADTLVVRETALGPLRTVGERSYIVHWIAHDPAALNLRHRELEAADALEQALRVASGVGMPAQNFVAGDAAGHIGWTIAGALPRRLLAADDSGAPDASFPLPVGGAVASWDGVLAPADHPRLIDPAGGQLSTANSRQLAGNGAALIGDGGFDLGARNHQARDALRALGAHGARTDVAGVYGVMLDDRALFIDRWRQRAIALLDADAVRGQPQRAEFARLLQRSWNGHASVDSSGYRLARGFMWSLYEEVYGGANLQLAQIDARADMQAASSRWPAVLERLLEAQPAGWLPAGRTNWRALQLAAVDRLIAQLTTDGKPLAAATWGQRNTVDITHPITLALPLLRRFLAAPADQLPGDANMPRVAGSKFGQSERLTVSPGREEEGVFNMPGGQSGHPLSAYFLRGHADWVAGQPAPLLPGAPLHTLRFEPAR
ncbi:penicillin acylase family protein [Massilia sp. PWRC2]|uniref:penicillin acylase family protein n=1 Tax=Massilia sp. PWRC2 TaxID=2804626 RepID=UPI003CF4882C